MMWDFADCVDKYLRQPWRFAIPGSDKLVTELSTYYSCTRKIPKAGRAPQNAEILHLHNNNQERFWKWRQW